MNKSRIAFLTTILLACLSMAVGSCYAVFFREPLTSLHKEELRPVMERYFLAVQNAYSTLDVTQLENVMTNGALEDQIGLTSPQMGSRLYYSFKITSFYVEAYTPDRARLYIITYNSNEYRIDRNGQRVNYSDESQGVLYTLVKMNDTWKVSDRESPR